MSYAPESILQARRLIQGVIPSLSSVELGIVGDDAHANSGTGYHIGKDALKSSAYSIVESARDRNGLTNAASALDVGWFTLRGRNLRDMSKWIVGQCEDGATDTKDIREIIYSPDGRIVKRWDALKRRSSGDGSHLTHTHISWFRDSESRDKTSTFRRWFISVGALEDDDVLNADDRKWISAEFTKLVDARVDKVAGDVAAAVLANTRFLWSADNPEDPASYRRNLADLSGDVWSAIVRGTTRGGDPLPADGAFGRIERMLVGLAARLDDGAAPVLTTEQAIEALRAEIRAIVRDGVA